MELANRLSQLPPYLFLEISRKIAEKRAQGADVVSFGIGDPDIPTPDHILDALKATTADPPNHRYPESDGLPEMRKSIANWYERRFGVQLADKEVVPLIGAKEGIGHMALCVIDPGDIALVPDPAYPVYAVGTMFAGGESHLMPLSEDRGWLPDLTAIPDAVAEKAKVPGYFSEFVRPKAAAIGPQIQDTFARAYAAGVKIAFGTDTGVSPHGDNWKEFGYMVEAGMPPMEAIQSATVSAAELLGQSERLGSIEPGKLADIIAVPGDPTRDLDLFGKVHFVMKGGVVFKHE